MVGMRKIMENYKCLKVHRDDSTHFHVYQCKCGKIFEMPDSACCCCIFTEENMKDIDKYYKGLEVDCPELNRKLTKEEFEHEFGKY